MEKLVPLLQIIDSSFPTGAFAHSLGLEAFVQDGTITDIDAVQELIKVRLLHGLATSDLLIASLVMKGHPTRPLDELLTAARPVAELRQASIKIGRRMLKSVLALANDPALGLYQQEIEAGLCKGHHCIVHGLACKALDIPEEAALLALAHAAASSQISAAVRLLSLGQTEAQQALHALQPTIIQAKTIAQRSTLEDFQSFMPALDIRAMQHQYLFRRLFIS